MLREHDTWRVERAIRRVKVDSSLRGSFIDRGVAAAIMGPRIVE